MLLSGAPTLLEDALKDTGPGRRSRSLMFVVACFRTSPSADRLYYSLCRLLDAVGRAVLVRRVQASVRTFMERFFHPISFN